MKLLTADRPASTLWSMPFDDKLRVFRTLALAELQARRRSSPIKNYDIGVLYPSVTDPLRLSNIPASPSVSNPAAPLQRKNPKALKDELIRHINEDSAMSSFEFAVQFLDPDRMTYRGRQFDTNFWLENASVEWKESESPFYRSPNSHFWQNRSCRRRMPRLSISTLREILRQTAHPSGASIAPGGHLKLPAEEHAAVMLSRFQSRFEEV